MTTYRLTTIADLLAIPVDRRGDCLRELEYALAFYDLALGEDSENNPPLSIVWTDDGDKSVTLSNNGGDPVLRLEVTDGP